MSDSSSPEVQSFLEELKKFQRIEFCEIDIDLEEEDQTVVKDVESSQEFVDIWKRIDSKAIRKKSFLEKQYAIESQDLIRRWYLILKTRFLIPISKLKVDYKNLTKGYYGKILITDSRSRALLEDHLIMKCLIEEPIGISAEFDLTDDLPKELKQKYHLIYLICLTAMSDEDFDLFLKTLSKKDSKSQTVFTFFLITEADRPRRAKLEALLKTNVIRSVQQLGSFQVVDHNIVVIDHNLDMSWTLKTVTMKKSGAIIERLTKRLTNFLEQIGEFPSVFRYFKTFHNMNESIAKGVCDSMQKLAEERKSRKEPKHANNFELVVIDRTIDFITPLTHCLQLRPFVFNELEKNYQNFLSPEYRKLNQMSVKTVADVLNITHSIEQIKELPSMDFEDKFEIIKTTSEVLSKIKNTSFSELMEIENSILSSHSTIKTKVILNSLKKVYSQPTSEVSNSDLQRTILINCLLINPAIEELKQNLKSKDKERQIDWKTIKDFLQLTHEFVKPHTYLQSEPMILSVVLDSLKGRLSTDVFPCIYKRESKGSGKKPKKLILFVLGGLSYSDLAVIRQEIPYEDNVIFCANDLITPKMFINSMIYE